LNSTNCGKCFEADGTTEISGITNNKCVKAGHKFEWNKTKFDAKACDTGSDTDPSDFTKCVCDDAKGLN